MWASNPGPCCIWLLLAPPALSAVSSSDPGSAAPSLLYVPSTSACAIAAWVEGPFWVQGTILLLSVILLHPLGVTTL
eukprot:12096477-Heterocapsa_arctica.AAC.1